ncbi:MAG TPA: hypothetical protein VHP13_02460 [Gammaproteobacteria bacterium]|nr:hypothetical protein [Gammaproteobacteria bacterium]
MVELDRDKIESARMHAADGRYAEALATIASLETAQRQSKPVLCLKGNILALKANDVNLSLSRAEIGRLRDSAQECFEAILADDKDHVLAYIDLGDLWSNRGNHIAAVEFFDKALALLKVGVFVESFEEELEEAHRGKIENLRLTKLQRELDRAFADAKKDLPTVDWM